VAELKTSIAAMRAISALLLQRFLYPIMFMIIILTVAAYVATILLSLSFSAWWWLLLIILVPTSLLFFATGYVAWFLIQQLVPRKLTSSERKRLKGFIDKLFDLAERTRTPYPVLLFLVAKDAIQGKGSSFVGNLIGDSRDAVREFNDIQAMFRE